MGLMTRMQAAYGGLWSCRITGEASLVSALAEWGHALADCSAAEIDAAVTRWVLKNTQPPTPAALRELIRPPRLSPAHRPFEPEQPLLPDPERRRRGRAHLSEIRRMLGMNEQPPRQAAESQPKRGAPAGELNELERELRQRGPIEPLSEKEAQALAARISNKAQGGEGTRQAC